MNSSEEQLETLARKIEQRELHVRRRAWLVTLIPIIFAGLFLAYTIWQITIKTTQLSAVETKMNAISAQVPKAQATLGAVQTVVEKLQSDLSQAQADLSRSQADLSKSQSALATATAQLSQTQTELDAARVFAQNACPIDEMVLKEYSSNYTPQAQMLVFLLDMQQRKIPWNPNGFSETDGFDSPDFALFALQNAVSGVPLVSTDYKAGARPWSILKPTRSPSNGDIVYYQSGYTMFYYELPVGFAGREMKKCVIGMTPLGIISQQMDFANWLGVLKVPYP